MLYSPRDGRVLRKERKPRHVMALQRFISRKTGFMGKSNDSTLADLGLQALSPSHYHRPFQIALSLREICLTRFCDVLPCSTCNRLSCDYVYCYLRRAPRRYTRTWFACDCRKHFTEVLHVLDLQWQNLASAKFPSVCIMADASSKGQVDATCLMRVVDGLLQCASC